MSIQEDLLMPAVSVIAPADSPEVPQVNNQKSRIRFTSNVVGSMYLITDVLCFLVSAPITAFTYSFIRGLKVVPSVHITAFILSLGSYLLIRSSRHAYRRSLLDLRESSDTTFDAVIS